MIKFLKDKWIFLVFVLVVAVILSVSGNINQSTSNARYRSEISGDDETRVAKWDVSTISRQNGATLDLSAGFKKTLGEETEGNWFIEIGNSSEVTAILGDNSNIRIRIDHDSYTNKSPETLAWNFLKDSSSNTITNPVTLVVTLYKGNIDTVISGYKKGSTTITKDEFEVLNESDKKDYIEVINSGVNKVQIVTTSNQTFTRGVESVGGKLVYFYYKDIKISDIAGLNEAIKTLNMNDSSSNITIGLNWKVSSGVTGSGNTGLETKTYRAYEVFEGSVPTGYETLYTHSVPKKDSQGNDLGNVNYYIAYRNVNFFDYQIFTAGFGGDGEPSFKFKNAVTGTNQIFYYSNLTPAQITTVNGYSSNPTTIEGFEHYVEKLRYGVHGEFVDDNDTFQKSLTYLNYGLKCAIQFTIKVEQKD